MPRKTCCCGDNYIAIPCRFYNKGIFSSGKPQWAHWNGGSPDPVGGFGGDQYNPAGPFRYVDGQRVFDTTRPIRYLMRGAGGGAAGVTIGIISDYGAGGNGAYIEYEKNADSDDIVNSGKGGSGWIFNSSLPNRIPASTQKRGGGAHAISGEGGGAAIIYASQSLPFVSAGAGGGAAYFYQPIYPEDEAFVGPRYGGNAGLKQAQDGQVGYNTFLDPKQQGIGGGASSTRGGSAGNTPNTFDTHALPGTINGGGRGQINNQGPGRGGGGGAGLYGGGGGANDSGGGGGSSTVIAGLSGYCFESKNNLAANYCTPYLLPTSGVGGKVLPYNSSTIGYNGAVAQYFIVGECKCDEAKNKIPDKLFICLTKGQYDQIITKLGDPPPGGFNIAYDPLFTVDGEDYLLLGICDRSCEEIYKLPDTADIVDVRWSLNTPIDGGELGKINTPACCSQIVCTPLCPLTGVNCANCGCDPYSEVFVCCDTIGKPDQYLSIYNGYIYSCSKSNNSWIIPGQLTETVTKQCLDPISGPQPICNQQSPESCTKTIDIPYTECHVRYLENCQLSISVQGPTVHYQLFGQPPCVGSYSYAIQGVISLTGGGSFLAGSTRVNRPAANDLCPNPFGPSYTLIAEISFSQIDNTKDEPIFTIEYDCVPTIEPDIPGASGIWKICDAEVNVIQGPLSNIIDDFNSLLGGRVTLTDLTAGSYYVGGNFPDIITRLVRTIFDGKATYTAYATHSYFIPCGYVQYVGLGPNVFAPEDDSGLRNALKSVRSYFQGAEQNAWLPLSSLNLVACPCTITPDPFDPRFGFTTISCPTSPPCFSGDSETEYDPYCGEMTVS
jgi:hypothetical protein